MRSGVQHSRRDDGPVWLWQRRTELGTPGRLAGELAEEIDRCEVAADLLHELVRVRRLQHASTVHDAAQDVLKPETSTTNFTRRALRLPRVSPAVMVSEYLPAESAPVVSRKR